MTTATISKTSQIMASYHALPKWVQIWMNFILGPVNLGTLFFLDQPSGVLIAGLSISGMVFTVGIVAATGGFTKIAAAGHLVPWTPLVLMLVFAKPEGTGVYGMFLTLLLITNLISLAFDYNDIRLWIKSRS